MFLMLIIISVIIILVEGLPLARKKQRKEFYTLISLLTIALTLGLVQQIGIPTPIELLEDLLYPFGKAIFR